MGRTRPPQFFCDVRAMASLLVCAAYARAVIILLPETAYEGVAHPEIVDPFPRAVRPARPRAKAPPKVTTDALRLMAVAGRVYVRRQTRERIRACIKVRPETATEDEACRRPPIADTGVFYATTFTARLIVQAL